MKLIILRILKLFFLNLSVIGLVLACFFVWESYDNQRSFGGGNNLPTTQGTVDRFEKHQIAVSGFPEYTCAIIKYPVENNYYETWNCISLFTQVGDVVRIQYEPQYPKSGMPVTRTNFPLTALRSLEIAVLALLGSLGTFLIFWRLPLHPQTLLKKKSTSTNFFLYFLRIASTFAVICVFFALLSSARVNTSWLSGITDLLGFSLWYIVPFSSLIAIFAGYILYARGVAQKTILIYQSLIVLAVSTLLCIFFFTY